MRWLGKGKYGTPHYWLDFEGVFPIRSACGMVVTPSENWYAPLPELQTHCKICWISSVLRANDERKKNRGN